MVERLIGRRMSRQPKIRKGPSGCACSSALRDGTRCKRLVHTLVIVLSKRRQCKGHKHMIDRLDHLELTTVDAPTCVDLYIRVLRTQLQIFGEGRLALQFGKQKIIVHERAREFEPKAYLPVRGALDFCSVVAWPLDELISHLPAFAWPVMEGPVERTGALNSCVRSMCAIRTYA